MSRQRKLLVVTWATALLWIAVTGIQPWGVIVAAINGGCFAALWLSLGRVVARGEPSEGST